MGNSEGHEIQLWIGKCGLTKTKKMLLCWLFLSEGLNSTISGKAVKNYVNNERLYYCVPSIADGGQL